MVWLIYPFQTDIRYSKCRHLSDFVEWNRDLEILIEPRIFDYHAECRDRCSLVTIKGSVEPNDGSVSGDVRKVQSMDVLKIAKY